MAFRLEFKFDGLEQVLSGLDGLMGEFRARTGRVLREWGPELVDLARELSPEDKLRGVDPRRRPKDERFALQWQWDIGGGRDPELYVGNVDERAHLVLEPTSAKAGVTARGPWMMKFWTVGGGPFKAWSIDKPATPGQPVHEWTIQEWDLDRNVGRLADELVR